MSLNCVKALINKNICLCKLKNTDDILFLHLVMLVASFGEAAAASIGFNSQRSIAY